MVVPERPRQFVAEEHHPPDLYFVQQADNASREGVQVLLPKLSPGLHLALREVPEVLQKVQVYQLRVRRTLVSHEMGSYVVRIKVLPTGPEVPSQQLLDSVKARLEKDMVFRTSREEPIAFGLYSLTST